VVAANEVRRTETWTDRELCTRDSDSVPVSGWKTIVMMKDKRYISRCSAGRPGGTGRGAREAEPHGLRQGVRWKRPVAQGAGPAGGPTLSSLQLPIADTGTWYPPARTMAGGGGRKGSTEREIGLPGGRYQYTAVRRNRAKHGAAGGHRSDHNGHRHLSPACKANKNQTPTTPRRAASTGAGSDPSPSKIVEAGKATNLDGEVYDSRLIRLDRVRRYGTSVRQKLAAGPFRGRLKSPSRAIRV